MERGDDIGVLLCGERSDVVQRCKEIVKGKGDFGSHPWKTVIGELGGRKTGDKVVRRDEFGGGFRVRSIAVPFTPLDVCFALGLRIGGEKVVFDEIGDSHTKELFGRARVTAASVYEKLREVDRDEHVDEFCRLYILLGFLEFYFPKTSPTISESLLKKLDDLESIDKYSWGCAVFEDLVCSLSGTNGWLSEAKNAHQIHLTGCTMVLQVFGS
ncbi:hypothetical protein SESBI_37317 [Sesbania bispinosa]|nr:hypothetical protein SESBI_37317 [Sesbania bispinosa]